MRRSSPVGEGGGSAGEAAEARRNFEAILSRARPKELAHDYLEGGWAGPPLNEAVKERAARAAGTEAQSGADAKLSVEELQRRARENWKAYRAQDPNAGLSLEEQQRQARERWKEYTQSKDAAADRGAEASPDEERTQERDRSADHGIEDDFGP